MTFNWKHALSPPFVAAALVLFVGAIGLQYVVHSFELFLSKKPLPLRRHLYLLPARFGPYLMENEQPNLPAEVEAVLGAEDYITREYRDTRIDGEGREGLIRLHIAYFTGTPDAVIHVPEVCYVAGGAEGQHFDHERIKLNSPYFFESSNGELLATDTLGTTVRLPGKNIPLRVFEFVPRGGNETGTVAYFFAANGRYMGSPEQVRTLVLDVRDKYAYWCKVEVLPLHTQSREASIQAVSDFLSYALPEVMACLPDWQEPESVKFQR